MELDRPGPATRHFRGIDRPVWEFESERRRRLPRSSLSFSRVKRSDDGQLQVSAYVIRYKLDLWSNFTYYLRDPINGDQMLQHDDRVVYGFSASQSWFTSLLGARPRMSSGFRRAWMTSRMSAFSHLRAASHRHHPECRCLGVKRRVICRVEHAVAGLDANHRRRAGGSV